MKNIFLRNFGYGLIGGIIGSLIVVSVFIAFQGEKITNVTNTQQNLVLQEDSAVIEAVTKVSSSVVSIISNRNVKSIFGGVFEQKGAGTGFVINQDGFIVTNRHVVEEDDAKYVVITAEGETYDAEIVAKDPFNDLAIVRIKANNLTIADLGDSDLLQVGQKVIAIGNALGEYQNTVTAGVISATDRIITAGSSNGSTETLEGILQTDAAINPGNSGGPLVNMAGQVIGINTAIDSEGSQIGFAIPINSVKAAIDSVLTTGTIKRPILGIRYIHITKEFAALNNMSVEQGALVVRGSQTGELAVSPGGPADKAGIQENDIITSIGGKEIDENTSIISILREHKPGDTVVIELLRAGKKLKVTIKLGESE